MFDIPALGMVTGVLQSLIFWVFVLVLILGLSIGPRYIRSRERRQLYDLMRTAYEKGQAVPPELIASLTAEPVDIPTDNTRSGTDRDLRRAVVLIAVGVGLACGAAVADPGTPFTTARYRGHARPCCAQRD